MFKSTISVFLLCFSLSIAVPAQEASRSSPSIQQHKHNVETGLLPAYLIQGKPAAKRTLAAEMQEMHVPAVSVAVIHHGQLEWADGYGTTREGGAKVNTETLFQAASMSKPVAAMAALRLVQEGKLDLDKDINVYLKDWKVPSNEFTAQQSVTLRELLSHTAGTTVHGFPGYAAGEAVPSTIQVLKGEKPANTPAVVVDVKPGTVFRYSGGGYTLMQEAIVETTGQKFPKLLSEKVLTPLRMTHSTYQQPLSAKELVNAAYPVDAAGKPIPGGPHTYPEMAAAGLWTTPSDLALFLIEMQQSLAGKANHILSQQMTQLMLTAVKDDYGLGFGLTGNGAEKSFAHGGSNAGYQSFMVAFCETGDGAIIMTNGERGSLLSKDILRSIAAEYNWKDFRAKERAAIAIDKATEAKLLGAYDVKGLGDFKIRKSGNQLIAEIRDGIQEPLYAKSPTEYFVTTSDIELHFDNANLNGGRVTAGNFNAPFTRKSQ